MLEHIRRYARMALRLVEARTQQEREERANHGLALLLVTAIAVAKAVTGLTVAVAPFTLYTAAVAVIAARGGLAPALVATLASVLAGGLAAGVPADARASLLFAAEGVLVALAVSALRRRWLAAEARRAAADATIIELRLLDRREHVREFALHQEWEDDRAAAALTQQGLQRAADDARQQLAALESLTDPSLNPLGGTAMVVSLLERLRTAVGADGVALVQPGPAATRVTAAGGLEPSPGQPGAGSLPLAAGRVAVVHNDPARVEQLSGLRWPAAVPSLLIVPVVHDGRVWSTIEVASERPRQVDDWDVALVRVVADRLAAVVVRDRAPEARAS
jgi:hypothetical protein